MALDFPTSPTDGQIYDNYYWDNTAGVWRNLSSPLEIWAQISGGTETSLNGYTYHTFTSSENLVVSKAGICDALLIGGGGGGGASTALSQFGGGGGAGDIVLISSMSLPAETISIVVGNGGVGTPANQNTGARNGESSKIGNLAIAVGGGAGGSDLWALAGTAGGSSGGVASRGDNFALPPLGFNGNLGGYGDNGDGAGGGGGAGGPGENGGTTYSPGAGTNYGGDGGLGTDAYSDWATATLTGENGYYCSGGGGGGYSYGGHVTDGGGARGGGSAGGESYAGGSGQANTGGGGGGGGYWSGGFGAGGAGGSGLVIVRVRT